MIKISSAILILFWVGALGAAEEKKDHPDLALLKEARLSLSPLPSELIDAKAFKDRIDLGKKLYFETKLSINNKISCNSCHMLDRFGVDNEPTSPGHDGTRGERNAQTVYNAALHVAQFWDGRAKDVEEQALGPILNPIEHGLADEKAALSKVNTQEYMALFKKAFPKHKRPFTYKNLGRAIGAFERTLLTPSRFDDFLRGDLSALSSQEKRGLKKFMEFGCVSCHDGIGVGGGQFQLLGAVEEFKTKDLGRFMITKNEDDKKVFKVPSLRNVEKTHPYFHDGSVKTLEEAIELMARHQLGLKIGKNDVTDIKAFLSSLTAKKLPKI